MLFEQASFSYFSDFCDQRIIREWQTDTVPCEWSMDCRSWLWASGIASRWACSALFRLMVNVAKGIDPEALNFDLDLTASPYILEI